MKTIELLKTYRNTLAKVALVGWAIVAPLALTSSANEQVAAECAADAAGVACSGEDMCAAASAFGVKLSFRR